MTRRLGARSKFALLCLAACLQHVVASAHDEDSGYPHTTHGLQFASQALIEDPVTVSCQLENGAAAKCLRLKLRHQPTDLRVGPFCPSTIDGEGGVWNWSGEKAGLYRVDRSFFEMIAEQGYKMFNAEGEVYVSDISKAAPTEEHTCIQVSEDQSVEITALIPINPVMAHQPTHLGIVSKIGLSVGGSPIFSDAPSVHHTGHMPALDTCGGHVDPGGWYHWHANANDIETVFEAKDIDADCHLHQDATAPFGYAFDGYPIYGSLEANGQTPQMLDSCRGHFGEMANGKVGYHYHTSDTFPNLPPCLSGVVAVGNIETTAQVGIGANPPEGSEITRRNPPGGGRRGRPNLNEAALTLGISEQALSRALRQSGRPPNLAIAAETLNVSEQDLLDALPLRPRR